MQGCDLIVGLGLGLGLTVYYILSCVQGCDLIVALTHMRVPNDLRLAREVPELHMILGGHDHHYEKRMVSFCCIRIMKEWVLVQQPDLALLS